MKYLSAHTSALAEFGQIDPITAGLSAGMPVFGAVVGSVAKYFGMKTQADILQEQQAKEIKAQAAAEKAARIERLRQEAIVAQQAQYQAESARRKSTELALYAVGGVALAIGGIFLISAMKKKKGK